MLQVTGGRESYRLLSLNHRKAEEKPATEEALKNLTSFVSTLMERCLASVRERLKREAYHLESAQLVRALDRVSGKLRAMDQLLPSAELNM